jgi:phage tail-like protein
MRLRSRTITRGFGTTRVGVRTHQQSAPPTASARAYLRAGLPAVYQENEFALRFVGALETVLDPTVALLDSVHAHVDPTLAPRDVLELAAAWLGVDLDESWPEAQQRRIVAEAAELARRGGTRRGLELALSIAFPALPLRVEDGGSTVWSADPGSLADPGAPSFVVYCDAVLSEEQIAPVDRLITQEKPVHVEHRLRVKTAKRGAES